MHYSTSLHIHKRLILVAGINLESMMCMWSRLHPQPFTLKIYG